MKSEKGNNGETRNNEIERLINEFRERFQAGTSQTENFITMSEIERMWSELRNKTDNVYSDMIRELMNSVDEGEVIRGKKENTKKRG